MPESARPNWTMVRVRVETREQLRELQQLWTSRYLKGLLSPVEDPDREMSVDWIVRELLARNRKHMERSRAASKRRAKKTPSPETGP